MLKLIFSEAVSCPPLLRFRCERDVRMTLFRDCVFTFSPLAIAGVSLL